MVARGAVVCDTSGMRVSFINSFFTESPGLTFNVPHTSTFGHKMRNRDPRNEELPFDSLFDQVGSGRNARTKRLRKMVARG